MENTDQKSHWENVYQTKQLNEVSWYQPVPETSLHFVAQANLTKDSAIIDMGGGDSFLADNLIELGYINISVLDISESALERAKKRLGSKATHVKWIVCDASDFAPSVKYDFWHDRAAFHFLTDEDRITKYVATATEAINSNGYLVMGTFSDNGPKKCSGLEIKQYNELEMASRFEQAFNKIKCITEDHPTPFNTKQNFTFCSFQKRKSIF